MQSRVDLFDRRGGDTVQIEKTAAQLRKLGVEVDIDCSANPNLSSYDLVHIFNIDWPAQTYLQAQNAKRQKKPIVFSPIHHSFSEIERYEREARYGFRRLLNRILRSRESRELFKDLGRMLADPRKIPSTLVEFQKGQFREQRELLEMSDLILVQTDAEKEDIRSDFGFADKKFKKVVNGVDPQFAQAKPDWFVKKYHLSDFILCVGRVEPRKNQLAVAKATEGAPRSSKSEVGQIPNPKLVFVGRISWRHPEYALRFLRLVRKHNWIHHIPQIPHEKMGSCYAAAKVHVLASWFETTGLVNLEAALAGANIVSSGNRSREYLGNYAYYCDPGDVDSIAEAIYKAWKAEPGPELRERILKNFTWEIVGRQTLAAYHKLL